MTSEINPLGPRVLLQFQAVEESTTATGLVLPQTHEVTTAKAEVIGVGDEVTKVSPGQLVLVTQGAGDRVEYEQEQFVIMHELDILAVLDRS